ncbi:MAG: hypothetical protein ABR915_24700, partial [Thermoguttaceae bacterium]
MEPADDEGALRLLDEYLARLQAGERPDREALLAAEPGLASALRCLEALEGMAPPALAPDGPPEADSVEPPDGAGMPRHLASPTAEVTEMPRAFGPYELLGEVGRGGMGV